MSTKTTFKRIALVTVAALGFGVLSSVAPATAAPITPTAVTVGTVPTAAVGVAHTIPITITATYLRILAEATGSACNHCAATTWAL